MSHPCDAGDTGRMQTRDSAMQRKHFLDWLRVGAFMLLILYHVGMFYVAWGWHVKSGHAPVRWIELPMVLMNFWRLPLLFFISGVALYFAVRKYRGRALLGRRVYRLLVPLLFGMYVICAPQAWYELIEKTGWSGSVWQFYRGYADWPWASPEGWPMITPTWNHLWYVLYVLVYSIVLILGSRATGGRIPGVVARVADWRMLPLAVPVLQCAIAAMMSDSIGRAQTLWGDWYNLTASFLIMALGFVVADSPGFWQRMRDLRVITLAAALALSGIVILIRQDIVPAPYPVQFAARVFQGWSVIWALLGWGQIWLDRDSVLLRYLSGAVFTWYILHQTVIIMVGVPLARLGWPLWAEASLLMASTVVLCFVGYHVVARRMGRFGVLLGARD